MDISRLNVRLRFFLFRTATEHSFYCNAPGGRVEQTERPGSFSCVGKCENLFRFECGQQREARCSLMVKE